MALPEQKRFTIEDLANRWEKSPDYVDELIRTCQFGYIIVVGELIAGSPLTRHVYFDPALWKQHYEQKIKDRQDKIRAETERYIEYFKAVKTFDGKKRRIPDWWMNKCKTTEDRFFDIGPLEVANLADPLLWKRPNGAGIYIHRSVVKRFERKHDVRSEPRTGNRGEKQKGPRPDVSEIKPEKWYGTDLAAKFINRSQKYVQNNLIPNGKLNAVKNRGRQEIQGRELIRYLTTPQTPP